MNSLQKLSKELPFIKELEELKNQVDAYRPFSKELEGKVFQKLRLDWNYNSNAIEGNSFTRGETVSLLMEGITAKGKPLKDALDIKGHNEAIDFMLSLIKDERNLTEADIRALHKLTLGQEFFNPAQTEDGKPTRKIINPGQYKTQPNHVKTSTGEIHYYATPEDTPAKMEELVNWYNKAANSDGVNAIVLASLFHHKFVEIHPFDDGNGRMTRLLTNFTLLKYGYPISVVKQENRGVYYAALSQADNGEVIPIIQLISETVKSSFEIILKAIDGQDISEEEDLDKEIELFRKESGLTKYSKISRQNINLIDLLFKLLKYPSEKLVKISDFFESKNIVLGYAGGAYTSDSLVKFQKAELMNLKKFKERINSKYLSLTEELYFTFSFSEHIFIDSFGFITNSFKIRFNEENYSIIYLEKKIVKFYDDKIYDQQYLDLMKEFVKSYMEEIKKRSK